MIQYRTQGGDVLDAICYQHYAGRLGATEAVLEANPGLADIGPILPSGIMIDLPGLPEVATEQTIKLWD